MKQLFFLTTLLSCFLASTITVAQPKNPESSNTLVINLITGSDDLRGGNTCYITVTLTDGTSLAEVPIGGGYGQNSNDVVEVTLQSYLTIDDIRSITIRHDGSPRSGHPFDTYDNWDLVSIKVTLQDDKESNIYNSANDRKRNSFVGRFSGTRRMMTFRKQGAR